MADGLPRSSTRRRWLAAAATLVVLVALAATQYAMGRVPICRCGDVKLWHGIVFSAENSQHLSDWYTFSHVIHGIGFYAFLWLAARRLPLESRFVAAVFLEAVWEFVENTPAVIDRYRAVTIALDYYGDSIVNSLSDVVAMIAGFVLARRAPLPVTVACVAAMELGVGWAIRDNLTLNIIMLLYPLDAIREWQSAGG